MIVDIDNRLGGLRLCFWWEPSSGGERLAFDDRSFAKRFLARLDAAGHGIAMRRLAAAGFAASRLDDGELYEQLAAWLVTGHVRVERRRVEPLFTRDGDEVEEAPVEARRIERPRPEEPEAATDEPLPPDTVDSLVQALALRRAAQDGQPFCEECEKQKASPPENA